MSTPTCKVEAAWADSPPAKAEWVDISDQIDRVEICRGRQSGTATTSVYLNGLRGFHPRLRIIAIYNGQETLLFEGDA